MADYSSPEAIAYAQANPGTQVIVNGQTQVSTANGWQPAPAVVTAQPAQNRINEVRTGYQDLQSRVNAPSLTQTQAVQTVQPTPAKTNAAPTDPRAAQVLQAYNEVFGNKLGWTPDMQYYLSGDFANATPEQLKSALLASDEYKSGAYLQPGGRGNPLPDQTPTEPETPDYVKQYQTGLAKIDAERESAYTDFKKQLEGFQNGTFQLNPQEQAYMAATQALFDQQVAAQKIANKNYEGAITQAGIAAGRNRYAPEIEAGNIQAAISTGIAKVQELQAKAMTTMFELRSALEDKAYKRASDLYNLIQDHLNEKEKTIADTYESVRTALKDQAAAEEKALKQATAQGKMLSSIIFSQLTDDEAANARLIQEYATQYGIEDPNILLAALNEYQADYEKDNAPDFETRTINGRVVRIGFDREGNIVSRTDLGSSRTTGGSPTTTTPQGIRLTKTEQGYFDRIQAGLITLDDVPASAYSRVKAAIEAQGDTTDTGDGEGGTGGTSIDAGQVQSSLNRAIQMAKRSPNVYVSRWANSDDPLKRAAAALVKAENEGWSSPEVYQGILDDLLAELGG